MCDVWGGRVDVVIFKRQDMYLPVCGGYFGADDTCKWVHPVMWGKVKSSDSSTSGLRSF
jgi:hypothetical protein